MKKFLGFTLTMMLVFLLAACGGDKADEDEIEEAPQDNLIEISDEERVDEEEVVVDVNGTEVTGDLYNLVYVQTKINLNQFGEDTEDLDSMQEAVVNILVDRELLLQDAKDRDITISDEEVDKEFSAFKSENEEPLAEFLKEYNIEEDAYRDLMHFTLVHEKYLEEVPEMEVSDDEVELKYKELEKENSEIPEYEDIKEQIRQGIKQDKLQEEVDKLKEKATINTLI